jgi:hypothetical protein
MVPFGPKRASASGQRLLDESKQTQAGSFPTWNKAPHNPSPTGSERLLPRRDSAPRPLDDTGAAPGDATDAIRLSRCVEARVLPYRHCVRAPATTGQATDTQTRVRAQRLRATAMRARGECHHEHSTWDHACCPAIRTRTPPCCDTARDRPSHARASTRHGVSGARRPLRGGRQDRRETTGTA